MESLYSFSDHVGGSSTQAIEAGTHGLGFTLPRVGERNGTSVQSESFVCDPFSFSASGCYPHSRFAARVNNLKGPLSFELENVHIWNSCRSEGINHLDGVLTKNHLRFYPDEISKSSQECADQKLSNDLYSAGNQYDAVCSKKKNQHKRRTSPYKIAFGAKSFRHEPIIAGETK